MDEDEINKLRDRVESGNMTRGEVMAKLLGGDLGSIEPASVSTDGISVSSELHAETEGTLSFEEWVGDRTVHVETAYLETPLGDYEITADGDTVVIAPKDD